jgi:CRP-like cAMP-binding protein
MQYEFPIFENLCPSWEQVLHLGTRRVYHKGALILDMGVPAKGVFFIQSGQIDTALYTLLGPEKVLYAIGQGCLFGEACCFSTGMTGEATVWARTECVLYFFTKETVEGPIVRDYPKLVFEMVGLLGHILRMYGVWFQDSLSQDYFARVCRILVYFLRWKLGVDFRPEGEVLIHADVTQTDFARLLGIHRRFTKNELDVADLRGLCREGGLQPSDLIPAPSCLGVFQPWAQPSPLSLPKAVRFGSHRSDHIGGHA